MCLYKSLGDCSRKNGYEVFGKIDTVLLNYLSVQNIFNVGNLKGVNEFIDNIL